MPYGIRKEKDSYVVFKKSDGKIVAGNKTKLSKEKADLAMRAIYAHSKD